LAVDRERLADVVLGGLVFPASGGFVPPGMPGHTEGIALPYDPEEARRLLAESGYPAGKGFPEIEFLSGGIERAEMIPFVRAQWLENLGLEVNWQALSFSAFLKRLAAEQPEIHVSGWQVDIPDPENLLGMAEWEQDSGWQNETYERLIEEARGVMDPGQRLQLYQQADRIFIQQAAIVPVYYDRRHVLLKPWVRRFPSSALIDWYWKDVIIEPH
jgi:oligopeptide transport system substrate-binding protein